jgi:hypothetical protein
MILMMQAIALEMGVMILWILLSTLLLPLLSLPLLVLMHMLLSLAGMGQPLLGR